MDDKEEEINRRTIRRRIPHLNVGTCHPAPPEEGWWDVPLVRDETNLGTRESATARQRDLASRSTLSSPDSYVKEL